MYVKYLLLALWSWIVDHGLTLAALIVAGVLIPRVGRLIVRIITERMSRSDEQRKSYLALVGALVYLLEIVGYFFLIYIALTDLGVSTVGAAVPATVVSAAIGFGAQKVIADFLAGFFIISEHQYGVGDVVSFDGTSDRINGTVVRLTLRATQIRSWNGELITLPNSQAGITINSSQQWSRAVVDLELPMTGDETMSSLAETVSVITEHAIDVGEVRDEILGEVSVLPAMNITPPTAAGLPWTVGIQVGVDVNPATQWKVQRIIRAALINEFWDRFQAPGERNSMFPGSPTQPFTAVAPSQDTASTDSPVTTAADDDALEAGEPRPSAAHHAASATTDDSNDRDGRDGKDGKDPAAGTAGTVTEATGPFESVAADVAENGIWRNLDTSSRVTKLLSVGGRIRPSSGVLVLVVGILAAIGVLSANPDGGPPGWLSPDRLQPATVAPAPNTSQVAPTPAPASPTESTGSAVTAEDTPVTGNGSEASSSGRPSSETSGANGSATTQEPAPESDQQQRGTDNSGLFGGGAARSTSEGAGEEGPQATGTDAR